MRTRLLLVALATSLISAGEDKIARKLLDSFRQVKWNSAAAAKPDDPATTFGPSAPAWQDADGLACFRRHHEPGGVTWSADYYALNPKAPACRLLRFRASTDDLDQETITQVYDRLSAELEREYGPSREAGKIHSWGSAWWRRTRQWDRDGLRILLFVSEPLKAAPVQQLPRVEILAEHEDVLRARAEEGALRGGSRRVRRDLAAEMETVLRAEVGNTLPKLNEMLSGEPHESRFDASTLRATIQILLDLASRAGGERQAALLLAADRVAARLGPKLGDGLGALHGDSRTETPARLRLELDHYGGWTYRHDLLERVWKEHEHTRWGEAAFVLLQEAGWYFGKFCPADPVFFPKVIAQGERFLKEHPLSPHRLETVFQLAQAYEDWWNAGHSPEEHFAVRPAEYEPRMDQMRKKAITSYEQVLAADPHSVRGRWAALRSPRLKLRLRTDRFRFVDSCH